MYFWSKGFYKYIFQLTLLHLNWSHKLKTNCRTRRFGRFLQLQMAASLVMKNVQRFVKRNDISSGNRQRHLNKAKPGNCWMVSYFFSICEKLSVEPFSYVKLYTATGDKNCFRYRTNNWFIRCFNLRNFRIRSPRRRWWRRRSINPQKF